VGQIALAQYNHAGAVALFGLYGWGKWVRYGTWPDASSPTIDLVAAPHGVWERR
jgi:hypothetical protein